MPESTSALLSFFGRHVELWRRAGWCGEPEQGSNRKGNCICSVWSPVSSWLENRRRGDGFDAAGLSPSINVYIQIQHSGEEIHFNTLYWVNTEQWQSYWIAMVTVGKRGSSLSLCTRLPVVKRQHSTPLRVQNRSECSGTMCIQFVPLKINCRGT